MNFLDQITVLISYNEAPNIGRTLGALTAFSEIVVLDSGSTDETVEIIARYPNARLVVRQFDQHAKQWSYGLKNCGIRRPWILALDADYLLSDPLIDEMAILQPADSDVGFEASFRYCIYGRPLTATLYPPHVVLYRRDEASYIQEGHTQRVVVEGRIGKFRTRIDHDDRKSLARWLSSQKRYAQLEANHLMSLPLESQRLIDKIRLTAIFGPILIFLYTLFLKRCILDGWPGWLYVLQRTLAEIMIAAELVDRKLNRRGALPSSR